MFNIFDDLFGGSKSPELGSPEILARIVDLELVVARQDRWAKDRISNRFDRREATQEQKEVFLEAFKTDLEVAFIRELNTITESPGLLGKVDVDGPRSISAAMDAYDFAVDELWEQATVMFAQAHAYGGGNFWKRSHAVCAETVLTLAAEPTASPTGIERFAELHVRLDVKPDVDSLLKANACNSALEWIEAWHTYCLSSRAYKNLINDEILEAARAGEWRRLLTYEHKPAYAKSSDIKISQPDNRSPTESLSPLGKHLNSIKDLDAPHQKYRVWQHIWWGAGYSPCFLNGLYNDYDIHQRDDGLWYLDRYKSEMLYSGPKPVKNITWGDAHKHWGDVGLKEREAALAIAWKINIYR